LVRWISVAKAAKSPAAIVRSRGLCPNPMVNPSFQVLTPNSKAKYKVG
jgi:hypothetical protein